MQDHSIDNGRESRLNAWLQSQNTRDLFKSMNRLPATSDLCADVRQELGRRQLRIK